MDTLKRACDAARITTAAEARQAGEHDADQARTATVHAREDVAALLLMQGAVHQQLTRISLGVWALVAIGVTLVILGL